MLGGTSCKAEQWSPLDDVVGRGVDSKKLLNVEVPEALWGDAAQLAGHELKGICRAPDYL